MRNSLVFLLLLAIGVAAFTLGYTRGWIRFVDPSRESHPIRGIDVSHHQGRIDWRQVGAAGIRFAFIKSTEGESLQDPRFAHNAAAATAAGIDWGPYHFFTFCTPGAAQAKNFRSTAALLPRDLPPVVDIEFVGNCRGWTTTADIRRELARFLSAVETDFDEKPILYVTREAEDRIFEGGFTDFPRWPRSLFSEPSSRPWRRWTFWQYADHARLPGIAGPVDLDTYCCSEAEYLARRWR